MFFNVDNLLFYVIFINLYVCIAYSYVYQFEFFG